MSRAIERQRQGRTGQKLQILTWLVDDQLFGMDIAECKEVVRDRTITHVPYAKGYVSGIVNLRGEVVTVLNLRKMLNGEEDSVHHSEEQKKESKHVIIRLKSDTQHVALKADSISDAIEIDSANLESAPAHLNEMETRFITNVTSTEKGLVIILNATELLKVT